MATQLKQSPATATLRSRYIVANGIRTHYTEAGDNGPVIVALPMRVMCVTRSG